MTDFGFTWGPMEVTRMAAVPKKGRIVGIEASGHRVQVYVSEQGRSIRFWLDGTEMTPAGTYP